MPCLTKQAFQDLYIAQVADKLEKRRVKEEGYKKPDRLQGVHNYDILANPEYAEKFHYIPCVYPERDKYVISRYKDIEMRQNCVDLVRIAINMPYMKWQKAKDLVFDPVYIEKHFGVDLHESDKSRSMMFSMAGIKSVNSIKWNRII